MSRGSRLSGSAAFERLPRSRATRRRLQQRNGPGDSGGGGSTIVLSNNAISDAFNVGDAVGTLAVLGGTGSYTFSLTSNPGGLFSITGSTLKVAAALVAGSDPITVHADNTAGDTPSQAFSIVVSHFTPPPSFVPTFELLGF